MIRPHRAAFIAPNAARVVWQLADQAAYARAVLGVTGAPTPRPYDGQRTPAAAPPEEIR